MKGISKKQKIVCLSGSFDPKYLAHPSLFKKAKNLGDKLIVLIKSDALLKKIRGFVLLSDKKRKEVIESIKYVDKAIITQHQKETDNQNISKEISYIKPDIFVTTKEEVPEKETCKKIGCKINKIEPNFLPISFKLLGKYLFKFFSSKEEPTKKEISFLKRFKENPILKPTQKEWESQATFNAGTIEENGKIHIIYRAIGDNNRSVLGYACSENGLDINYKFPFPAYDPEETKTNKKKTKEFPPYISGGGWQGGAEDPRLTMVGSKIYMTYTSFDGASLPYVSMSSIKKKDFLNHNWNWSSPIRLSPKGEINKNWVIFPEKINGKFAILHSISPTILISYIDDLEDEDNYPLKSFYDGKGMGREDYWDSWVRGAGPPPLKTKEGWLLFYHAMENSHSRDYKIGAFLLDFNDPTNILARSSSPLLSPDKKYETQKGFKPGVVYTCGAGILNDKLFLYYGSADTFLCGASAKLEPFLEKLKKEKKPKLKPFNSKYEINPPL